MSVKDPHDVHDTLIQDPLLTSKLVGHRPHAEAPDVPEAPNVGKRCLAGAKSSPYLLGEQKSGQRISLVGG